MNNSDNKDELRFNKLYELLGEDINKIYDTKEEDNIFTSNEQLNNDKVNNDYNPIQNEDKNIQIDNEITNEIYIEPTKVNINENINNKKYKEFNDLVNPFDNKRGKEIKDKSNYHKQITFDDGLDTINDRNNNILSIISNRKVLYFLCFMLFVFIGILVFRAIKFSKVVDKYNDYTLENDIEAEVYSDSDIDDNILKGSKARELVNCISKPIDTNNLPDSINSIIKDINNYYRSSNGYFAFTYKDIFTGFTVSYNENAGIFAASTIKAPVNIYLYEMASLGKINLDDELTYTGYYYNNGTGLLKNKPLNTKYTIRELSAYAIINSDNAAHNMLMDKYGKNNMLDFWREKGTNVIFTGNDNWGMINAHDATIYMEELYKFYLNNSEYGEELMNNFLNAKTKFIIGKNNYKVANKTGWSGYSQHDAAIVFADNPYIVIALSYLGMNNNYMSYFNRVNDLAYSLHTEYWKYKMNTCNNIKLYEE